MISSLLLDWAVANPGLAFLLSLPTAASLMVFSWVFATMVTGLVNILAGLVTEMTALGVVLIHGYPPSDRVNQNDKDEESS